MEGHLQQSLIMALLLIPGGVLFLVVLAFSNWNSGKHKDAHDTIAIDKRMQANYDLRRKLRSVTTLAYIAVGALLACCIVYYLSTLPPPEEPEELIGVKYLRNGNIIFVKESELDSFLDTLTEEVHVQQKDPPIEDENAIIE